MEKHPQTDVERSRLTLLLGLSSTAAAAGCFGPQRFRGDSLNRSWQAPASPARNDTRPGGEAGDSDGGHDGGY